MDARDKQINKMEALEDSVERNCPSTEVVGSPDQYFQDDWHWQVLPTKDCRGVVGYLDGNQAWIRRGMFPRVESVGHVISVDSAVTVVSMLDSGAIYPPQPDLFVAGLTTSTGKELWRWSCPSGFDLNYVSVDGPSDGGREGPIEVGCKGDWKDSRASISGNLNPATGAVKITDDERTEM